MLFEVIPPSMQHLLNIYAIAQTSTHWGCSDKLPPPTKSQIAESKKLLPRVMNVLVVFGRVDTVTEGVLINFGLALEPSIKAFQSNSCLSRSLQAD